MEGRLLARARAKQETLRAENRAEEDRRRREIAAKIPEIGRIDTALCANLSEMVRIAMRQSARTAPVGHRAQEALSGAAIEYIHGLPVVKSFGQDGVSVQRFRDACRDNKAIRIKNEFGFVPWNCLHLFALRAASVGLVLTAGWQTMNGTLELPVLLMAAAEAFGTSPEAMLAQAMGIEMFHNFTLLHDDVMDNADVRRGRPTVHRRWNASAAILSGDAMLTMASQLMGKTTPEKLPAVLDLFNTTAMEIINAMAKTYVPRNFLIMYQSSRFRNLPLGSFIFFHILQFIFLIILSIRVSPSSVSR